MLWSFLGDVAVIVHDTHAPSEAEWADYLVEYRARAESWRALLIYSLGGGPSGKQRSELSKLFDEMKRNPAPYIVTSSMMMRGIATAISWFLPPADRARAFALDELDRALSEMSVTPAANAEIKAAIQRHLRSMQG